MSNECNKCGLTEPECQCYIYKLEDRILDLEEELDELGDVVRAISENVKIIGEYLLKEKDER